MPSTPGLNNAPGGSAGQGGQVDRKVRHPKTSYKAKYYYNDKRVWEAGHELEFDSTKEAPRIRMAHCDGSYFEYSKGGHKVESTKGHEHKYVQGGLSHTVENNSDFKFNGNVRTSIGKGVHVEVNGQSSIAVSKELVMSFGKSASILAVDDLFIIAKNTTFKTDEHLNVDVGGDMGIKTKGNMNFRVKGSMTAKVDRAIKTESGQNTEMTAKVDFKTTSKGDTKMVSNKKFSAQSDKQFSIMTQDDYEAQAKKNMTSKADQKMSITGTSGVTVTGATIDMNK